MAQWIKNPPTNARDMSSIPGLRRSPGEGNGNPLQYSCLGRQEAWWATVHGVTKSQAQLRSDWAHTEHNRPQTCRMLVLYLPSRENSNHFRGLQNTFQNIYKSWYVISNLQSKIMKHTTKQERRTKYQQYLPSLGLLVSLPGRDVPGLMLQRGLKNGGDRQGSRDQHTQSLKSTKWHGVHREPSSVPGVSPVGKTGEWIRRDRFWAPEVCALAGNPGSQTVLSHLSSMKSLMHVTKQMKRTFQVKEMFHESWGISSPQELPPHSSSLDHKRFLHRISFKQFEEWLCEWHVHQRDLVDEWHQPYFCFGQ